MPQAFFKQALLLSGTTLVLGLGACNATTGTSGNADDLAADQGGTTVTDTESLLDAEGTWHLVEAESAPTPLQQHLDARDDVNTNQYKKNKSFVENAEQARKGETVHYRLLRMEREMASLRKDFNKLLPPLSSLIISDRALDQTIGEIQTDQTKKASMPDPVKQALAPIPKPAAPKPVMEKPKPAPVKTTSKPVTSSGPTTVNGIRFGQHPDKTRMVLDLTGPAKFTSDIDNAEKLLIVDIQGAGWSTATSKTINNPLIKSYSVQPSGSGNTILILELKKEARVSGSAALKPRTNPDKGHRIFIDISG